MSRRMDSLIILLLASVFLAGCGEANSHKKTYVSGLEISFTSGCPANQDVIADAEVIISHILLEAVGSDDVSISSITLNATGTGNDLVDISLVEIFLDVNGNDDFDSGTDALIGSGTYDSDDGQLSVSFSTPQIISTDNGRNWLVRYRLNGNGPNGATYAFIIKSTSDVLVKYISGPYTSTNGVPLASSVITITSGGAKLNLLPGPTSPANREVLKGMSNINVMQFTLYNRDFDNITVDSIQIAPSGSGDDSSEIFQARIYIDENGNGRYDSLETLYGDYTYASDDSPAIITGSYAIASNTMAYFLVVYDFDLTAVVGSNFQAAVAATNHIQAHDVSLSSVSPKGPVPLEGAIITVAEKGSLHITKGSKNPADGDAIAGNDNVPVIQLEFEADVLEDVMINSLTLHASGTANDTADISQVRLYKDADNDGEVSSGDTELSSNSFASDNGTAAFSVAGFVVPAGQKANMLVSIDIPATALNSSSFQTYIDSNIEIGATGILSSLTIDASGIFPIDSGLFTVRVSDSFIVADSLNTARFMHTQTSFLDPGDGEVKVLVCGGNDGSQTLESAEIYTPKLDTWTTLESAMSKPRMLHTATLLSDGQRVLIAGGTDGAFTTYGDGEIFDPATYTFTGIADSLTSSRQMHTAVLTNGGQVFIFGGQYIFGSPQFVETTEYYNQAANRFDPLNITHYVRILHTLNSLSGGTLVATGGLGYAISGPRSTVLLKIVQLWSTTPTISESPSWVSLAGFGRCGHSAVSLPGGELLIAGGYDINLYLYTTPPFSGRRKAEIISENSSVVGDETIRDIGEMSKVRFMAVATLLPNGEVLIAGGADDSITAGPLSSAEIYNPSLESFRDSAGTMVQCRYRAEYSIIPGSDGLPATSDDLILITGGLIEYASSPGPVQITSVAEIYVP